MNTGQICMVFEADNLETYENLLKSQKIFWKNVWFKSYWRGKGKKLFGLQ